MNPTGVIAAFLLGALVSVCLIHMLDRRAIRREAEFWEEMRAEALDSYGRVFDWADEPEAS